MDPVGSAAHEEQHVWRYFFRPCVNTKNKNNEEDIQCSKDVLGKSNVATLAGDCVEQREDVDETCWIHQWPSVTLQLGIVGRSIEKTLHLLHIGFPVDLRVINAINYYHICHYLQ